LREIRGIGIASTNNVSVHVDDVVDGGRVPREYPSGNRGVIVGHQTRLGRVAADRPLKDNSGKVRLVGGKRLWDTNDDVVEGIVLLRKNEQSLPAVHDVEAKVEELNKPGSGRLLPGVKIEPYYDRTDLTNVTRDTVNENLTFGMILVSVILLMFSQQHPRGADRGDQYSAGLVVRLFGALSAGKISQLAVDRRRRFRHHRRFVGDHGREYL